MTVSDLIELLLKQPPGDHVGVESEASCENYGTVIGVKNEAFNRDRVVILFQERSSHE